MSIKKILPSSGTIFLVALCVFFFWAFYGVEYPQNWVFANFINSSKILQGLSFLFWASITALSSFALFFISAKYDDWRK